MAIMKSGLAFATIWCLVNPIGASPHPMSHAVRQDVTPTCTGCWALSPQCSNYSPIPQLVSSMENPPATETGFTATAFCSAFLQNINFSYATINSTEARTSTSTVQIFTTSTTTVAASPTLSVYCATPTPGITCGLSNGAIIDPTALNEDESETSPVSSAGDCYQRCLANPSCKSYFTSQWINGTAWNCDIFRNSLKGNVISAVPGSQFYDRGCPENLPSQCSSTETPIVTSTTLAPITTIVYITITPSTSTLAFTTLTPPTTTVVFTTITPTTTLAFTTLTPPTTTEVFTTLITLAPTTTLAFTNVAPSTITVVYTTLLITSTLGLRTSSATTYVTLVGNASPTKQSATHTAFTTKVIYTTLSQTKVALSPAITAAPKPRAVEEAVLNYSTSLPAYLSTWYASYYGAIIPLACSCLITSASPDVVIPVTETQVIYNVTETAKITQFHTETAFETPYLATVYTTIA